GLEARRPAMDIRCPCAVSNSQRVISVLCSATTSRHRATRGSAAGFARELPGDRRIRSDPNAGGHLTDI
ncbi:MAG TPA: hypothetical protein VF942_08460, partial [Acidimicrobiales bacterium]